MAAIDTALEHIAEGSLASPVWRTNLPYRRHVLWRFPFLIFFTVSDEAVDARAFSHAKRRPGYWTDR